ncbi:MAG TPA: V-type ATP synthase subunit E [Halobacteriales archaeon]|nr:V-type ATP synthase subunit E [Halobacteriales archaeon]
MSLETVVQDIRETARERAEEIRAEGEARAEEIVAEAESDAEEIVAQAEREADREVEREREQRVSSANLEAKQARLAARRDLLASVRDDVEEAIAGLSGDTRESLTRELLGAAAAEFEDVDSASVYGRAEDAALLESLVADFDGYEYAGEYDCLGGVVVESESSRLRVNNTFDSIVDDVWEEELREIAERLFEDGGQ